MMAFTCFTKDDYQPNWHHISYARKLDEFIAGKVKRLMVFIPPQHGKSELCSRRMPAMLLGRYPNKRIAVVSYNTKFAAKFNRSVQRIIDSPEYRKLFPKTTLNKSNIRASSGSWLRNSDEFEIVDHRGSLISVGIGGGLTGNKVDIAIIDDLYKDPAQANSRAYRDTVVEWWNSVLETRLAEDAQICVTFTRWRNDDIAGHLLEMEKQGLNLEKWHVVKYEALKDKPTKDKYDKRKKGQALWPKQKSARALKLIQKRAPHAFNALYQQDPQSIGGNLVKGEYFFRYEKKDLPRNTIRHAYIDTATSDKELRGNDPTGILVYSVFRNKLYLIDFIKGMWSSPDLIEAIQDIYERQLSKASEVWIENKSNGRSTKQILDRGTKINSILENIKGSKSERMENELPTLKAGRVGLPLGAIWVDSFLAQCEGFPLLTHDEEIDCLTGAIRTGLGTAAGRLPGMY